MNEEHCSSNTKYRGDSQSLRAALSWNSHTVGLVIFPWGKTDRYSKASLHLTRLLSNVACQVVLQYMLKNLSLQLPACPPACLPAQQPSAWADELLPWLLLKHPTNTCTHTQTHVHVCARARTHTHLHRPSRPLPCLSAKRGINTPPLTACTHVIEGKKGGEEEEGKDEHVDGRGTAQLGRGKCRRVSGLGAEG